MTPAANKSFRYAAIALKVLEKVLGSKFTVNGIEDLPNQPILFVSNHFTRFETFVVPYLIYKNTGRQVRCLADSGLYYGTLGKFLNSVGTISTKNINRDNIILKDLITARHDWMIYPEGSMIKSKETKKESRFINYTPDRIGHVRTGSSVLALKSQLYRNDIVEAFDLKKTDVLEEFKKSIGVEYQEYFRQTNTYIVPLSISYYPIRPGNNSIKNMAARLVNKIPSQVAEELEIEGNLLLDADINLSFGAPVHLGEYVKSVRGLIYQIPIIKNHTKTNFILKYFKHRLTNDFMNKIYSDLQINLDHLFSAALYHIPEIEIEIDHLKRVIYLSAVQMKKYGKYRLNHSVDEESLYKIFIDEPHFEFDSAFELAKKQGLISELEGGKIKINKEGFSKKYDFHEIRRENTLKVIVNEFFLLERANNIVIKISKIPDHDLRKKVFHEIHHADLQDFESDYNTYFDKDFSKEKSVGSPFFLDVKNNLAVAKKVAILVCHGYKSAPKEVEELAKFVNDLGLAVYGVRLKGHGTTPINMKYTTWIDWYNSMQHGYAALRNYYPKVVIIGFSTGGLLGLLSCAKKHSQVAGIISINSALKLLDIRTRFVPGINIWNEMLQKLSIEKSKMEYVDDRPENPQINYSRNYLKAVAQLDHLMKKCDESLSNISTPALIIQAKRDPVVNPISGKIVFEKIKSENKFLFEPDFSNHCIINGDNKGEVFESIRSFLSKLNLL